MPAMAQLSDDCFAYGTALLTVAEALALIDARVVPVVGSESVPLRAALGRVLAEDVVAAIDLPPHANSAVDGYAVRHADLLPDRDTELPIGGRAAAGHPLGRAIRPGEAIRIFTAAGPAKTWPPARPRSIPAAGSARRKSVLPRHSAMPSCGFADGCGWR